VEEAAVIREQAFAKVNLVLHVGSQRADGLHPLCSLVASLELADELTVEEAEHDQILCPGVEGDNLARRALAAFREAAPGELPPLRVRIDKRVPVAAGLGGGSADAAAVLRAANERAGAPLDSDALRALGAGLGSDVPSMVEPRHALVGGAGELIEPLGLPAAAVVLVPATRGLLTRDVYAELDRLDAGREQLDAERLRALADAPLAELARAVENDLQRAALSLRPELARTLAGLGAAGALAAAISGSGPTAFGLFETAAAAERAAAAIPDAIVTRTREPAG
jgi:4-diphosphocytidyl-2-C-methyl-D-erythritol kinase